MHLQPVSTICRFLGKDPRDSGDLILSGLPVAKIPGAKKHTPKVVPAAFFRWMEERLGGDATTEDVKKDFQEFLRDEGRAS